MSEPRSVWGIALSQHRPERLVAALGRAGALGVVALGADAAVDRRRLSAICAATTAPFGILVSPNTALEPRTAAEAIGPDRTGDITVLLDRPMDPSPWREAGFDPRVAAQIRGRSEAQSAIEHGIDILVAKGSESGGRIGDTTTFILLQQVLALAEAAGRKVDVLAQGGIGPHTAAASAAGGAAGVVLDAQLALVREAQLPRPVRDAIRGMDGSETTVLAGHRVYTRPDLPVAAEHGVIPADTEPEAAALMVQDLLGAADLRSQLLPIGQDAALAHPLARTYVTAAGVVQAITHAMSCDPATAATQRALAPGGPLAAEHGLAFPIAQGPMTRVSDRAPFAKAVSDAGALPFLALALLRGDETRSLLTETAALLGDRPWGVGILGFVPPELREEQLEVVRDIHPPFALIAGGRPSQAAPLEHAGIPTFLHVPSPGLLDRFIKDGARRFVFEGRECGGHVGPRSSFALWETQVDHILASGVAHEIEVFFAGGIHDERSAAMVAALAAPLVAAGTRIGVLMGTAYLFTDEAVAGGAILPHFQQEALDCAETVLLETSPGHATRCVDSPYVAAFAARRDELTRAGVPVSERWAELESLNLGRLRIASKGLMRTDDGLTEVDEATQATEGMFMIGDVATMRSQVTTAADLHVQVTAGSTAFLDRHLDAADAADVQPEDAEPLDTAIVGMAGFFPEAIGSDTFWANILSSVDAVTEVPPERWDPGLYYDPASTTTGAGERTPSKWGGFLPEIPFDALAYGIPPTSLAAIEPVQLLSLEAAARALADAGYAQRPFDRSRTSVVFGAEAGTDLSAAYGFRALLPTFLDEVPSTLDQQVPKLTEDSFPGLLTNVIAGRIANRLDLGGLNCTVDAACAASLAALDVACKELVSGGSDMVVCGGADLHNGIHDYLLFASVHALSPRGRCRTFDNTADGICLGEGIACVVLKRLADAERDGDRVYAVIKSVAGSSDGRHLGLTAPRKEGQRLALERAYARAGISPADVRLVEAHGTGTTVGDRTELATLTEVFREAGAEPRSVSLGSVKSMIGHTKCAAGLAGLIKAAEAVHRGVLPPTLHVTEPNSYWDRETSPFRFENTPRPWTEPLRVAGVSAFGFGGSNFHVVLTNHEGEPAPEHGADTWPAELFVLRGRESAAADARLTELRNLLDRDPADTIALRDLAAWAGAGGQDTAQPVQLALVASDHTQLRSLVDAAMSGETPPGVYRPTPADDGSGPQRPRVAFLYPGQGSQRPNMLGDLFVTFPELRRRLDQGAPWAGALFPTPARTPAERAENQAAITDTRVAQPTLGIAGMAITDLFATLGVAPDMAGGHSYGELVALWAAGAIPDADLLALSETRGQVILDAAGDDPGTMAAVSASPEEVDRLVEPLGVVVANRNSPSQAVISGSTDGVEAAVEALEAAGRRVTRIPVACAFHSPVVAGARDGLLQALEQVAIAPARFPVWSNATATPYPPTPEAVKAGLADQVVSPVRFVEQVEAMYDAGARVFVEAGPGRVLTRLVGLILGDRPHRAIACDAPGEPGVPRFLHALAELAVSGVPLHLDPLFDGRTQPLEAKAVATPAWRIDGHLVRGPDGSPLKGGLLPANRVEPVSVRGPAVAAGSPGVPGGTDEAVVAEFLHSMRELVAAQRDVMVTYLGGDPGARPTVTRERSRAGGTPTLDTVATLAGPTMATANPSQPTSGAPSTAPGRAPLDRGSVVAAVTAVVAERTGYPTDMLDGDLDLEADLSIDSIKRIEILGELAERIDLPGANPTGDGDIDGDIDEEIIEELAQIKTINGIADWIVAHAPETPTQVPGGTGDSPTGHSRAAGPRLDRAGLTAAVTAVVAERTGYPTDMLDGDLDLEADLSIDSIKRIEILGELAERIDLPGADPTGDGDIDGDIDEEIIEELAQIKTINGIVSWILDLQDAGTGQAAGHTHTPTDAPATPQPPNQPDGVVPPQTLRFTVRDMAVPTAMNGATNGSGRSLNRSVVLIRGSASALATELGTALVGLGALPTRSLAGSGDTGGVPDAVIDLTPLEGSDAVDLFEPLKGWLEAGVAALAVVTGDGGRFGHTTPAETPPAEPPPAQTPAAGGHRGLVRTAAREYPDRRVAAVDIDPGADPSATAQAILSELTAPPGREAAVGIGGGTPAPALMIGLLPEATPTPVAATPLDADSVVLCTGGGRGITARTAIALARRWKCSIALVGRTAVPEGEPDAEVAAAQDVTDLRRLLIARGQRDPRQVEREARRLWADREIRATLDTLSELGVAASYHTADVGQPEAMTRVIAEVQATHGRLDGIIHGAGVLADHLIRDKSTDEFRSVYDTKVRGIAAVLAQPPSGLRFVVCFASISGVIGNRGQADYAAANETLDTLAHRYRSHPGRTRPVGPLVTAIDWGPWGGGGMVSEELEREYRRRGVGLIDPDEGVDRLLDEIAAGLPEPQVVMMCAHPEALDAHTATATAADGEYPVRPAGESPASEMAQERHTDPEPIEPAHTDEALARQPASR